jgi:hypothetical protein
MTIKRPEAPQLDAIFATVEKIHRAEKRLAALREQVAQEARALAEISDKRVRIEAGFYAYWFAPEVPATDIAMGATGRPHPGKLLKLAGPVSVGMPCDRCREDLPIRSRSHMKEVLEQARSGLSSLLRYRLVCIPCQNALQEEALNDRMAECDAWEARQRELAKLSYAEYLQTPEFEERRDLHLWWLSDRMHALECETCNADTALGMYHKCSGEGGGFGDTILLCTSCRDALVAGGRLAGPPCERNLLPPELLASFLEAVRAELSY